MFIEELINEKNTKMKTYTFDEAYNESLKYFKGDELAAKVWVNKYALKDSDGNLYESNPDQMHHRMAKEIARIELEKNRETFTVNSLESSQKITIGKLTINVKIDRIDNLKGENILIIDYKTGKTTIQSWFDERPDEPQLLLYAVGVKNPCAIAFAQINPEELSLKAVCSSKEIMADAKEVSEVIQEPLTWQQQLDKWQVTLENLADAFYNGNAEVDPKHSLQTCRYCHLQTLCRIYESQ